MSLLHTLILSIVEGISEFLPISSTAHLILASHILKIEQSEFLSTFEIVIQLGAIFGVALLYAKKLLTHPRLILIAGISFLPTGILGFLVYPMIKTILSNDVIPVIMLFLGGIILIIFEKIKKPEEDKRDYDLMQVNISKGLLIGLIQSLAMIPGVSRSAASIIGGMSLGLSRKEAAEFSFILAIPTMMAASGYDLLKTFGSIRPNEYGLLFIGMTGSAFVAFFSVKWLLKYIQNHTFTFFGIYRIAIALIYSFFFIFR